MLTKKIQLFASIDRLRFSDGRRDISFDTKLFVDPDGLIAGVGTRPIGTGTYDEVGIFDRSASATERLAAAIHYGLQEFSERLRILPGHLHVFVSRDLVDHLGGFEKAVFKRAGSDACASKVEVSRIKTSGDVKNKEAEQSGDGDAAEAVWLNWKLTPARHSYNVSEENDKERT